MKKIIFAIVCMSVLFGVSHYENNYTRESCVVVKAYDGMATIEDSRGFTWDYEGGNLNVGDVVDLKMHTNNTTSYIDDDVITKVVMQKGK